MIAVIHIKAVEGMTTYEMLAREKKAQVLATELREIGVDRDRARRLTDAEWCFIAELAGCNPPKSQATKDLVIRMMGEEP